MRLVHPDGDMGVALAAKAQGLNHILSSVSMYPMEEVHAAVPDAWFQLYKLGNEDLVNHVVELCEKKAAEIEAARGTQPEPLEAAQ